MIRDTNSVSLSRQGEKILHEDSSDWSADGAGGSGGVLTMVDVEVLKF